MRLVIVRQDYRPEGAAERVTERALEALLERNVAVSLYTRSSPQTRLQLIEPVTCDPFYVGALWRDWGFARAACKIVRRAKPTLVEAHEPMVCCDVYHAGEGVHAVWLEERMKRASPLERIAATLSPRNRYRLAVEKRLYASPWLRAVICNCRMVRDEIRGRFGLPESRLPVVYNPVDGDLFHPGLRAARATILERHRIAADATVYLVVAHDFTRCGVGTAIAAIAELAPPSHLIVVGDDPDLDRYRETARTLGVAGRVTLAGPHDDLRPYYGAADAFVLPSLYDPSPRTVQEAMACGLATITSTKSGGAELVQENDAGLVCPPGDARGLAAHMRALQDPATRRRVLRQRAPRRARAVAVRHHLAAGAPVPRPALGGGDGRRDEHRAAAGPWSGRNGSFGRGCRSGRKCPAAGARHARGPVVAARSAFARGKRRDGARAAAEHVIARGRSER